MNPRILAISGRLKGSEFIIGEADLKIGQGVRNHVCHAMVEWSLSFTLRCRWASDRTRGKIVFDATKTTILSRPGGKS